MKCSLLKLKHKILLQPNRHTHTRKLNGNEQLTGKYIPCGGRKYAPEPHSLTDYFFTGFGEKLTVYVIKLLFRF